MRSQPWVIKKPQCPIPQWPMVSFIHSMTILVWDSDIWFFELERWLEDERHVLWNFTHTRWFDCGPFPDILQFLMSFDGKLLETVSTAFQKWQQNSCLSLIHCSFMDQFGDLKIKPCLIRWPRFFDITELSACWFFFTAIILKVCCVRWSMTMWMVFSPDIINQRCIKVSGRMCFHCCSHWARGVACRLSVGVLSVIGKDIWRGCYTRAQWAQWLVK